MDKWILEGQESIVIKIISKLANSLGMDIFLVGGVVRDLLLGIKPKDIDIVVEGDVFALANNIQGNMLCRVVKSQQDLRTIKLDFGNGIEIDFAATRHEIYGDRKGIPLASAFGCPLQEDVMRRDFSINALAISLNSINYGDVVDYVNGQEDLKNKKLSVLHDFSFLDDPTRIIRAFKFSHRLGFDIEEHTKKLMNEYLDNVDYSEIVSPMRIKKEFYEVFNMNSVEVMEDFINQRIYKVLTDKINDIDFKEVKNVIETYNLQDSAAFIYLIGLFLRKENYSLLKQFNLTKSELKIIQDLKHAEFKGDLSDVEVYQLYSNRTKESLALELLLKNNPHVQTYIESLTQVKIEISGEDLLMMGVPESKNYSFIFDKVLEEKIKGNLPDKISELRYVRKLLTENEM